MVGQTRSRRNQTTYNHVLLQATQPVLLTGNGSFGQHACGFLEGSRGNERLCRERCLGDTQQDALEASLLAAIGIKVLVDLSNTRVLELLTANQFRFT